MNERTDAEIDQFLQQAWEGVDPDAPWAPDTPEERAERAETMELTDTPIAWCPHYERIPTRWDL